MANESLYNVLGVTRNATDHEIRKVIVIKSSCNPCLIGLLCEPFFNNCD